MSLQAKLDTFRDALQKRQLGKPWVQPVQRSLIARPAVVPLPPRRRLGQDALWNRCST